MRKTAIEITFLIVLTVILWILSREIPMHKLTYMELDWNPGYKWTLIGIIVCYPLFNHFVLKVDYFTNIIYSSISGLLLLILAKFINSLLVSFLWSLDNQQTPFGWEFKYRWLDLLFYGVFLVLSSEFIGIKIKKRTKIST